MECWLSAFQDVKVKRNMLVTFNCYDFCFRWCCYVMLHADQDGEKLQALLRLLTELVERVRVVDALSTVPQMYCLAVVEVVRRKMFMRHYREVSVKC